MSVQIGNRGVKRLASIGGLWMLLLAGCSGGTDDDIGGGAECTQDDAGHAACNDALGWAGYCGPGGDCIEASGCEAQDCCVPGAQGDDYCASLYGPESVCVADTDGYCSQ